MNAERKETIIKEILYWKENKLLPEHYCNYLIALYTEGEGIDQEESISKKQRGSRLIYVDLFFLLLLIPFSLLVAYVTDFHWSNKLSIYISFLLVLIVHFYIYKKRYVKFVQFPIIISFLIMLIGSTTLIISEIGAGIWLNSIILLNCLIWIVTGYLNKQIYLTISGFLGIVILAVVIVI